MATAKDIILEENDYLFKNGDFVIGESDAQHIQDIIFENTGAYKQFPLVGVGIKKYLNASGKVLTLTSKIRTELTADGYAVENIVFNNKNISDFTIYAERN